MPTTGRNWLQIKVMIALAMLLLGTAAVFGYLSMLGAENQASQELLSRVRQLDTLGQAIQRRSATYAEHAPRDYGPYDRDLIIFFPDYMRDLQAYEAQVRGVHETATHSGNPLAGDPRITTPVTQLLEGWQGFMTGFRDKIGDNPAEPRLEWAAEYVRDNKAMIAQLTVNLIQAVEDAIQQRQARNELVTVSVFLAAGAGLLLGIIWFYYRVVRRIGLTVRGCQRVAQGDFGYQLPITGEDELARLGQAFNTLSARTRLVVNMLSKMHRPSSHDDKLAMLLAEATGYLDIQTLSLWQLEPDGVHTRLLSLKSATSLDDTTQNTLRNLGRADTHLAQLCQTRQAIKIDHLSDYVLATPHARLLRELTVNRGQNAALLVPLATEDGWRGLLLFSADAPAAYTDEQAELLGNMSGYMAHGFAQTEVVHPA